MQRCRTFLSKTGQLYRNVKVYRHVKFSAFLLEKKSIWGRIQWCFDHFHSSCIFILNAPLKISQTPSWTTDGFTAHGRSIEKCKRTKPCANVPPTGNVPNAWLLFEIIRFLEMNKHDSRFRIGLTDHYFRIEHVGRSALLLTQAFCTFAVFYFMRASHSRRAVTIPR